jgi:hypothetical protein
MKRNEWTFEYTASKIAEAAQAKKDKHAAKLKWWEDKKAEVMKKVTESGIEVQDSVAASYSNTRGDFGPQIRIDSGLQRDLSECQNKIMEHHGLMNNYGGWVQVLTAHPEARLSLEHDDYLFFFGE